MENEIGVADKSSWVQTDVLGQLKTGGRWRWLVLLLACSATALVSFRHTLFLMVDTWSHSRTFSHCFLVLPLFVYLLWVRRENIIGLKPVPNYWGLPLLGVLTFIWLVGNLGEVKVVQEFAVISILIVIVWTILGTVMVRRMAFPLLFLFFAVPFGTSLIKPLQNFTGWFVIHALTISNVPAVLENHTIFLPSSVWTVAEACSGIRFLLSSLVLGTVFSFLMYRTGWRRLIFMCASVVAPIVGNGLRAYGVILLAYITSNKLAVGVDHVVYGGLFAVFIEVVLMVIGLRWRQRLEPITRIAANHREAATAETKDDGSPGKAAFFAAATASILIVIAPFLAVHLWNRSATTNGWADPPVTVTAPWQATGGDDTGWAPEWHGPDREFSQSYKYEKNRVDLDWVLYSGRHGMEPGTPSDGLPNTKPWVLNANGFGSAIVGGRQIEVCRSLTESRRVSRSVWTWYWVNGEYAANRARVRFLRAKARILGKPAAVAVISLGADIQTNASDTERTLQEFLVHASFLTTAGLQPSS